MLIYVDFGCQGIDFQCLGLIQLARAMIFKAWLENACPGKQNHVLGQKNSLYIAVFATKIIFYLKNTTPLGNTHFSGDFGFFW